MNQRMDAKVAADRILWSGRLHMSREHLRTLVAYLDRTPGAIEVTAVSHADHDTRVTVLLRMARDPSGPNGVVHKAKVIDVYRTGVPELLSLSEKRAFRGEKMRLRYPLLDVYTDYTGSNWLHQMPRPLDNTNTRGDLTMSQIDAIKSSASYGAKPLVYNGDLDPIIHRMSGYPDDIREIRRSLYVYLRAFVAACPYYRRRVAVYSKDGAYYIADITRPRSRSWLESRHLLSPGRCQD